MKKMLSIGSSCEGGDVINLILFKMVKMWIITSANTHLYIHQIFWMCRRRPGTSFAWRIAHYFVGIVMCQFTRRALLYRRTNDFLSRG